jgi:hypothetical protein
MPAKAAVGQVERRDVQPKLTLFRENLEQKKR